MRDESVAKRVDVLHHRIGQQHAGAVVHDLVDVNQHATVLAFDDPHRINRWIDGLPLPRPIATHGVVTMGATALCAGRPVDIRRERAKHAVEVTRVEGGVERNELRLNISVEVDINALSPRCVDLPPPARRSRQ